MAGRGRRPYALESMLRVHLMQNWFALSDPAMEEALYEIASLRTFAHLNRQSDAQCFSALLMQLKRQSSDSVVAHRQSFLVWRIHKAGALQVLPKRTP